MVLGDAVGLYYLVALCGGLPGSRVLGVVIVVGGGCYGDLGCIVCGSLDLWLVCFGWVLLDSYGLIVLYILRCGNHFAFCCWVCIVFWVV